MRKHSSSLVMIQVLPLACPLLYSHALHADTDPSPPEDAYFDSTLSGDWGGWREKLGKSGLEIDITQTSDLLGNTGGNQQGGYYDGLLVAEVDVDIERMLGWSGASLHLSGYLTQGEGLTEHSDLGVFLTPTNIEYYPAVTKLGELWFQQEMFDGRLAIKLGQIEADLNFNTNASSDFLVNSSWGWLGIWSANLPDAGPTYPNPVPAIQVILTPDPEWIIQAAVFNGSPTGNDPLGNTDGLRFPLGQGALTFIELAYEPSSPDNESRLPNAYKLGGWYHSGEFYSLTTTANGRPLNDSHASVEPKSYSGNYALYATAEQPIWYETDTRGQGLNIFGTFAINPQIDRNLVDWLFDVGLTYTGLIEGRPLDRTGIGYTRLNMSPAYANSIRSLNDHTGTTYAIPSHESFLELGHQAVIRPWLKIQPFFQYLVNPGQNQYPPMDYPDLTILGVRFILSL